MKKTIATLMLTAIITAANAQIKAPGMSVPIEVGGKATTSTGKDSVICDYKVFYDTSYSTKTVCGNVTKSVTHDSTYKKCTGFWIFYNCKTYTVSRTHDTVVYSCIVITDTTIRQITIPIYCDTVPVIEPVRPPGSGVNLIWAPATGDDLPEVKSLQGIYRWMDVQPTPST